MSIINILTVNTNVSLSNGSGALVMANPWEPENFSKLYLH